MQRELAAVRNAINDLRAVLDVPLMTEADHALLREAEVRNTRACIEAARIARLPSPDADGWEF